MISMSANKKPSWCCQTCATLL